MAIYFSGMRSGRTLAEKIRDSLEVNEGRHYELEEIEAKIEMIEETMEKVCIVVVALADVAVEAFQRLSEALTLSYTTLSMPQFFENIQNLEEAMAQLAEEYDNVTDVSEQKKKTKASYKRNIMLQNRRYKTQIKVMSYPIYRRKFFVRKLP